MVIPPKPTHSRAWHRTILAAGFVIVAWFYAWTNDPTAASLRIHGPQSDYYNVLIHGFLKGHLYMDFPVAKELLACPDPWNPAVRGPNVPILQDATYYNGHYYLYYGVAPLTLMLPFRLITGADMPLALAAVCFACAGLLAGLILWESIRDRYFPEVRPWVGFAAALIIGVASPMPVLLRRTLVYELPIASGCCFGMAALLALYWSIHSHRFRIRWLVLASVCLGLAVASRLTFLFAMPILLIPVWRAWGKEDGRKVSNLPFRVLAGAVVPIAAIGVMMAIYNFERYGQFGQFGTKYQVAEMFNLMNPRRFAAAYVPFNLVDYFLATPDLSRHFPYFYFPGAWHWPIQAPSGYWGPELVPGLLVCFPICGLAALSVFAAGRGMDPQRSGLGVWLLGAWALFATTCVCLLCYYAGAVRYMVDFTPSLMLCAAVGVLVFERWLTRSQSIAGKAVGRGLWLALLFVSVLIAVMFSLGVRATFRSVDPVGHARVARFFERLSFWNPQLPNKGGPVEITVRLDKRLGIRESEPLFAGGAGDFSEHVFLRRSDDDHVVVGYRFGLNAEAQLSAPIPAPPGGVLRLYLDLGSLYPGPATPVATPSGTTLQSLEKLKQRWVIVFGDEIVLQGNYHDAAHHSAGNLVFLGCDPNSDDFGKILLTPVIAVRRLSIAEAAARAAARSTASLEFKPPRTLNRGSETLVAVRGPAGDFRIDIDYLGAGQAALKFLPDGRKVTASHLFPNHGQWHRLSLDQVIDGRGNPIHVRMDGAALATIPGSPLDLRHDELRPGWGTASIPPFTGLIRNAASDSAEPVRLPPRGNRTVLTVIFPRQPNGMCEPLLATGRNGAGDLYEVMYLDHDQAYFRHDHWGVGIVRASQPMKLSPGVPHRIIFEFTPAENGVAQAGSARNGVMHMKIDGQRVWEKDAPSNPFTDDEVYVARNDLGGSTCAQEFTGEIISCDRSPSSGVAEHE